MPPKFGLVRFWCFALAFALSGCGLLGGNPTSGIGVVAKSCKQDPNAPTGIQKCLRGTELAIIPYVQVWGNETGDCYGPYTPPWAQAYPSCAVPANMDKDFTLGDVNQYCRRYKPERRISGDARLEHAVDGAASGRVGNQLTGNCEHARPYRRSFGVRSCWFADTLSVSGGLERGNTAQHAREGGGHQRYGGNRNQQPRQEGLAGQASRPRGGVEHGEMQQGMGSDWLHGGVRRSVGGACGDQPSAQAHKRHNQHELQRHGGVVGRLNGGEIEAERQRQSRAKNRGNADYGNAAHGESQREG